MYEIIEFTDANGMALKVRIKVEAGIRISNIPVDKEWTLTTQDANGTTTTELIGGRERRG